MTGAKENSGPKSGMAWVRSAARNQHGRVLEKAQATGMTLGDAVKRRFFS